MFENAFHGPQFSLVVAPLCGVSIILQRRLFNLENSHFVSNYQLAVVRTRGAAFLAQALIACESVLGIHKPKLLNVKLVLLNLLLALLPQDVAFYLMLIAGKYVRIEVRCFDGVWSLIFLCDPIALQLSVLSVQREGLPNSNYIHYYGSARSLHILASQAFQSHADESVSQISYSYGNNFAVP